MGKNNGYAGDTNTDTFFHLQLFTQYGLHNLDKDLTVWRMSINACWAVKCKSPQVFKLSGDFQYTVRSTLAHRDNILYSSMLSESRLLLVATSHVALSQSVYVVVISQELVQIYIIPVGCILLVLVICWLFLPAPPAGWHLWFRAKTSLQLLEAIWCTQVRSKNIMYHEFCERLIRSINFLPASGFLCEDRACWLPVAQ